MGSKRSHVYLDHNAGAPIRITARDRIVDVMDKPGNASSVHRAGRAARGIVEDAREAVARMCGSKARNVTFVSGGTEANATVLTPNWQERGSPLYLNRLLCGATEHPSVLVGGRFSPSVQSLIPVNRDGLVDLDALEGLLNEAGPALVSVMAANNETGVVQPLSEIGARVKAANGIFHVDAVQAVGRMQIDLDAWQADAITVSAHKIGGAQGTGAVVTRSSMLVPSPLLTGGGQENWRRAGTENVAAICGFGAAASDIVTDADESHRLTALRDALEAGLRRKCQQVMIFGVDAPRIGNTSCFAVEGVAAETALIAFDLENVCVSSGSACSSGKVSVSHVLTAMGVEESLARCALRVSFGWNNTQVDVDRFLEVWSSVVARMNPAVLNKAA